MSSSLTRTVAQRAYMIPRAAIAVPAHRTFTTTIAQRKTATETVKDGLKKADRVVSDNIAIPAVDAVAAARDMAKDGVEKTREAAKDGADKVANTNTAAEAEKLKGQASGKASELQGRAKGAAKQAEGQAKGAAEEIKQKL